MWTQWKWSTETPHRQCLSNYSQYAVCLNGCLYRFQWPGWLKKNIFKPQYRNEILAVLKSLTIHSLSLLLPLSLFLALLFLGPCRYRWPVQQFSLLSIWLPVRVRRWELGNCSYHMGHQHTSTESGGKAYLIAPPPTHRHQTKQPRASSEFR